jgi:energy-coupling factor transport system ATP-binding protein
VGERIIEVEELSFQYRGVEARALDGVSLGMEAGTVTLVAGPSGCGKSTLLRCLNGLIPHSYKGTLWGEARLQGEDIFKLSKAQLARRVGTVLQDPSRQIVGSTVGSDVAFGPENLGLGVPDILGRVGKALGELGLEGLRERETQALSGGEQQKVAIAGLLALEPGVLLLDEPLANLDPKSAFEALELFRELANKGHCVVLVEHRVDDALTIAPEQVVLMEAGRVTYQGNIEGMRAVADYRAVKLPAEWVIEKTMDDGRSTMEDQGIRNYELRITSEDRAGKRVERAEGLLVEYKDVWFAYPRRGDEAIKWVVKGVSGEIRAGDRIAVLGPNGSGKSTIVKQAMGLLKPQRGEVLVDGVPTTKQSVAKIAHTVGYVFQNPGNMLFAPTVREELAFGPKNLGRGAEQVKADVEMALEVTNLVPQADRPPLGLSFGQQKRVALASVLSMRPRVLVMDEPTAGQDYANYTRFMEEITSLPDIEGVVFITHDMDLAIAYANRVWLVKEGMLAADGRPEEVLSNRELLRECSLVPTSLLEVNLKMLPQTGRFMRAEELGRERVMRKA